MKRLFAVALATLTALAAIQAFDADAARMSGGRSIGAQRSITPTPAPSPSTTTPSGAASNPVMPAQPGVGTARPAAPSAAPSAGSRWLGPIAGLAAGIGLAALLSHFGLSEGFASFLLLGLLVVGAVLIVRMLMNRRAAPATAAAYGSVSARADGPRSALDQSLFTRSDPAPIFGGATAGAAASSTAAHRIPAGFDVDGFLRQAKLSFTKLQAAYDRADRSTLADLLTPEMQAEIERDLAASGAHAATDVVSLDAELLEVVTEGDRHWASVRFSGMLREDGDSVPQRFEEIWNLAKPADGSVGWRLAGIQQTAQV
jgi:predicted lipid-binding transport protein (Tim44 family)